MKTTKIYLVVCLTFLLTQFNAFAQYNGGNSNGATANQLSLTSCSIPPHFNAYFGGVNDGSGVEELSTTTCGTAAFQFAYMGGRADGAATEEASITACGIPPSFYAYFGGNNDGANVETLEATVCPFPPSFYAYFGGNGDGFTLDTTAPICPTQPPVADFTASAISICVGQSVTFTDTSTNIPSAWTWTFTGGTPNSSIVQNPVITYNTPGSYAVTLVAANFNGTDTKTVTGYITVTAYPTVQTTTPASRCDTGTVTLGATASAGTLSWYANPTGGTALGTGISFITPSISLTTTYYVETVNATCSSSRTAVIATVNTTPTVTSTTPASRCDAGSVNLAATVSAGGNLASSYNWYNVATGGTPIANSNSFVTPSISITTTYYIAAVNGVCISPRTAVIATVNTTPIITSTTPASRCDSGTVTLGAGANSGTLNWYNVSTGGSSLATGTSFITPSLSTSTNYYVDASNASCTSARILVSATINVTPTIASTTPSSRCDAGTVTLSAVASTGNVVWYDAATGGTALATTNSFTTPSISITTTYYVEAVNGSCASGTRTAVVATVTPSPTITSTTPTTICAFDTFTISATASAGSLAWYNVPTGGIVQGSGTSFSLSNWSATTTFYVQATNNSCQSARIPVVVTVNQRPTNTAVTPASRCDAGTLTLGATFTVGTINWFTAPSGGTSVATGSSYTTPSISSSTTYYVEATNGTCVSLSRTAVTATINNVVITSTTPSSRCNTGTVTLSATASSGNTVWYSVPTGGTALATTNSFTTPSIATSTTYYVEATNGTCTSTRTAVVASVTSVAVPTGNANQTFCAGETVGLLAITTGTNIVWYNAATNGSVVPNSTALVSGTTYYATQNNGTCDSPTRLAVTATLGACLGNEEFVFKQIKLYPNPVTDLLTISNTDVMSGVTVIDMLGRILASATVNDTETRIDMSNYPTGTYLVQVSVDSAIKTFKVIKR